MKKFFITGIIILAIITIYDILALYNGIYIKIGNDTKVDYNVSIKNGKIYRDNNEFYIKGVELTSFYPGYNFSDYSIDKVTYKRWLEQIAQMGANTIRVSDRMDPEFYEALYEFNKNNNSKLYLLQGIDIREYDANNASSIYGFKNELIKNAITAVDVIHGNRYVITSGIAGRGLYNKDVSEWTLGYILTNIGKEETIAYTDYSDKKICEKGYNGDFFYTNPGGASETECIVAEIMDKIISYESNKYKEQRLVSLMIDLLKDPFQYKENVNILLGKMAFINMNNIKEKDNVKAGKIVSYNINTSIEDFGNMLKEEEIEKYKNIIDGIDKNSVYGGYIDFINKYYDSPVLIASYGFSTARVSDYEKNVILTEEEQGENLINNYKGFIKLGSCGGIISTWQDNWSVTTWNVKFATEESKEIYWHNKESIDQNFGILKFEQEDKENICIVDGDIKEWKEENKCAMQDGIEVYCKYDYANLYIMAKNIKDYKIYIPIDITDNSGSMIYNQIKFERPIDFLIKVDKKNGSEIIVQEYYDSTRAMYEDKITGERQFTNIPKKDSSNFNSIKIIQKRMLDINVNISLMTAEERIQYRLYRTSYPGKLVKGNNNPNSEEYNSLADICFGENAVEMQIPWQILNFSSPSELLIHDDYYQKYGVENKKIDGIYIGIGNEISESIDLNKFELKPWARNLKIQEVLKKSYEIIKKGWNEEKCL